MATKASRSSSRKLITSDLDEIELTRVAQPPWAVAFGKDRYGAFADFELPADASFAPQQQPFSVTKKKTPTVRQRLRWINPGTFQMGSPDDEPGRFDNEVPHHVTITSGFWMFDRPCTQALWMAVMGGENPSQFPDPDRPVEQVNWDQAREFADNLSRRLDDLPFRLPTEAEWEYACRARTHTALYTGSMEIQGDANAPALDPIAWYGGNSGHEFDRDDGQDVSDWLSNKQYDFKTAGTRKVAYKAPNPWGLFDMLGNVWEWCEDWLGDYGTEDVVDPTGPEEGSRRVVRGGCWVGNARSVRSAYRFSYEPGDRGDSLGFRLLSSVSTASSPVSRRTE